MTPKQMAVMVISVLDGDDEATKGPSARALRRVAICDEMDTAAYMSAGMLNAVAWAVEQGLASLPPTLAERVSRDAARFTAARAAYCAEDAIGNAADSAAAAEIQPKTGDEK